MKDKILVPYGLSYADSIPGLGRVIGNEHDFFKNTKDYKLVLFTGGSDISPEHYNDTSPDNVCFCNPMRDVVEIEIAKLALANDIIMCGICRGAQLLNVFSGGRMMHHIDGHAGAKHKMSTTAFDFDITVNSLHHQMMIPGKEGYVISWCSEKLSKDYIGANDKHELWEDYETEGIIIQSIKGFGVQYHPEMMSIKSPGHNFFYNMVKNALTMNFDDFSEAYIYGNKKGVTYLDEEHVEKHMVVA